MVAVKALGSAKPVSLQRMRSGDEAGHGLRDSHRNVALIREAKTRLPLDLAMIDALDLVDELRIDPLAVIVSAAPARTPFHAIEWEIRPSGDPAGHCARPA